MGFDLQYMHAYFGHFGVHMSPLSLHCKLTSSCAERYLTSVTQTETVLVCCTEGVLHGHLLRVALKSAQAENLLIAVQMEAQEFLGSCSCPEYLRRAEKRLQEEAERVVNYLDPSSEPKITLVVENELIKKQVPP